MAFEYLGNPYKEQKTVQDYAQQQGEFRLSQELGKQKQIANDQAMQQAKAESAAKYLSMATPENWGAIRQKAIAEGLGDDMTIPAQYDDQWIQKTRQAFATAGINIPSAVQEYQFFKDLPQEDQSQYLQVKRANPYLNLGDTMTQPDPVTGAPKNVLPVNPKVSETPDFQAKVETAKETAKTNVAKGADIEKSLAEINEFKASVGRFRTALGATDKTGYIGGAIGNVTNDAGRIDLVSAQNELTLRAKTLLGMPSNNFSDADRNFLTAIAGGSFGSKEGLGKVADRLEKMATDQESLLKQRGGIQPDGEWQQTPGGAKYRVLP